MENYKTVVLGATTNPSRYAWLAVDRLNKLEIEVIPVGIRKGKSAGVCIQNGFPEVEDVHTITLYLSPENQKRYYDYIISLNPKRVIFNPGTENHELYSIIGKQLPECKTEIACTLVLLSIGDYKN
jgi:uncharacterized protein